jgi:hypothetical protein
MDAQLQQIIEVQAEQNQLLKKQLRWLKGGLLTLMILATAATGCLGYLIHANGTLSSNLAVLAAEPILEHPISLAENDTAEIQFPVRIKVPEMGKTEPAIQLDFDFPVSSEYRPGRGCDGMCL